jgi:hypothetical protein
MRRTNLLATGLLLATSTLSGCIYADVTMPLDTDLDKTTMGAKTGESKAYSILWLVAWGDAGTKAAANQGAIATVNHADQKYFSILWGLFSCHTTLVYGD